MSSCQQCNHSVSLFHDATGCRYPGCTCHNGARVSKPSVIEQWLKPKKADPLKDEPWYAHLALFAAVTPIIITGILLGLLGDFFIHQPQEQFLGFVVLLVVVNMLGIIVLYGASDATIKALRAKIREHEARLSNLESAQKCSKPPEDER